MLNNNIEVAEHVARMLQYTTDKKPMPLIEGEAITRLTKYLTLKGKFWTKEGATYLVNGIDPETIQDSFHGQATIYAMSFAGERITENTSLYFRRAKEVLDVLNLDDMPEKISPIDFIEWCVAKGINTEWITNNDEWGDYVTRHSTAIADAPANNEKPWLIPDPRDPAPEQPWYTPARYFARKLIEGDSTLLTNKPKLEEQVVLALNNAGIKNARNGKFFRNNTILKAWANVDLG